MTTLKNKLSTSPERALNIDESKEYFAYRLLRNKVKGDGNIIDAQVLNKAIQYDIKGTPQDQTIEMVDQAVERLQGVEGNFTHFTVEALDSINREYFDYLVDASYSQDTGAPGIVAQGIGASEHLNGEVFTTMELLETAPYIVDDYQALVNNLKLDSIETGLVIDGKVIQPIYSDAVLESIAEIDDGQALADALEDLEPEQLSFDFEV